MTAPMKCQLIGRWRIVGSDTWDRDYLDLNEPACIDFGKDGRGEFAFGVLTGSMDLEYGRRTVFFTWGGSDDMDEVTGSGVADLQDDGTLEIEISIHFGDAAVFKAERWPPSRNR